MKKKVAIEIYLNFNIFIAPSNFSPLGYPISSIPNKTLEKNKIKELSSSILFYFSILSFTFILKITTKKNTFFVVNIIEKNYYGMIFF